MQGWWGGEVEWGGVRLVGLLEALLPSALSRVTPALWKDVEPPGGAACSLSAAEAGVNLETCQLTTLPRACP